MNTKRYLTCTWTVKCGETDFCLGIGEYLLNRISFEKFFEELMMNVLYGGKHEKRRFSL